MSQRAPVSFSHVGIFVRDLDTMVAFYTGCLGLAVSDRAPTKDGGEIAFLTGDPREHHQLVLASGRPPEAAFTTVQQISFRVDSIATLRRLHARIKQENVVELGPVSHGNALSAYFRDPEGNRFEIFMDLPWHVAQPMRISVDLALPDAEIWALTEAHARQQAGFKPRAQWEAEIARKLEKAGQA